MRILITEGARDGVRVRVGSGKCPGDGVRDIIARVELGERAGLLTAEDTEEGAGLLATDTGEPCSRGRWPLNNTLAVSSRDMPRGGA